MFPPSAGRGMHTAWINGSCQELGSNVQNPGKEKKKIYIYCIYLPTYISQRAALELSPACEGQVDERQPRGGRSGRSGEELGGATAGKMNPRQFVGC